MYSWLHGAVFLSLCIHSALQKSRWGNYYIGEGIKQENPFLLWRARPVFLVTPSPKAPTPVATSLNTGTHLVCFIIVFFVRIARDYCYSVYPKGRIISCIHAIAKASSDADIWLCILLTNVAWVMKSFPFLI